MTASTLSGRVNQGQGSRFAVFPVLLIAVALSGCLESASPLDMVARLPVYRDGYDVDRRLLFQPSNQQLSYKLRMSFPATEVLESYDQYLVEHGWKKCTGPIEEWQSFIDATIGEDRMIHQVAHYFVIEAENKFGMVALRYESAKLDSAPDNDVQNVVVLMQKGIDLQEAMGRLSITC